MGGAHLQGSLAQNGKSQPLGKRVRIAPPPSQTFQLGLTRVIQEASPPWAPMMYRTSRVVVATKQNTDTNITHPWTSGMGTRDEAIRIHTKPPKTCRGSKRRRVSMGPGRGQAEQETEGRQRTWGHCPHREDSLLPSRLESPIPVSPIPRLIAFSILKMQLRFSI